MSRFNQLFRGSELKPDGEHVRLCWNMQSFEAIALNRTTFRISGRPEDVVRILEIVYVNRAAKTLVVCDERFNETMVCSIDERYEGWDEQAKRYKYAELTITFAQLEDMAKYMATPEDFDQ